MIKDNKNLEIKFGGDLHEIDVDLLIESLVSYSSVTQEVSAYLSPGTKIDIKIKAPKEGSFIILLNMIAQNASDIFINTKEGVYLASNIVTLVGGLYCLKKWISKNGKPETIKQKEGNIIEISNNNGNIIISNDVYNIYQENPRVRDNLRNTFIKLKEKDQIKDFCIRDIDNNKEIFKVDKKDFSLLASSEDEINVRKQKVIKENQELSVFKVVF